MAAIFAAAYLLVLQSVLGAFAFGSGPNPAQLDAFGNVICTHEGAGELPSGDPHQQHMPACCVLGCAMASSIAAPPPDAGALLVAASFEAVVFVFPVPAHLTFERDRSPSNPRAPPLAA